MSLNKQQWDLISTSVIASRQNERIQQQAVYRVFQSLSNGDDFMLRQLLESGIVLDFGLHKDGDSAAPRADEFFPPEYPFKTITPVFWAAFNDDVATLKTLYESGADILFPAVGGRDAMTMALWNNSIHAWDWLRDVARNHGMNIPWNQRSNDGKRTTRLMDAVVRRCVFAVQEIVNHVDVGLWDATGKTALHYNFLQEPYTETDSQIARILVEYGAPTRVQDQEGVSVAALASTPEQQALMDRVMLQEISDEARLKAEDQRNRIKASQPNPEKDPTDPGFPQIQKPVRFKKPFM